jgi:hypothetical protein
MKKLLFSISLLCLIQLQGKGQGFYATDDKAYTKYVDSAFASMNRGDCRAAIENYEAAFAISQKSTLSRLRAAVSAYECNQEDKWKLHANTALNLSWSSVQSILNDANRRYPEIYKQHDTPLFEYLTSEIEKRKKESGYNDSLARALEIINQDDQELRMKLNTDISSTDKLDLYKQIQNKDSANIIKIEAIIEKWGYPGNSLVGNQSSTAFLVIQHASLEIQEKYYPLLLAASEKGELSKSSVALLTDRIRVRKGQPQIYGSQLSDKDGDGKYEFDPIENEVEVNKRRFEIGMESIEDYAKRFGIIYKMK